jgi:MYXO-CTERM domain-containing protein
MKKILFGLAFALMMLASASVATAGAVNVTIDGVTKTVDSFNFAPGNTIAVGAIPLTANTPFNFFYQSALQGFSLNGNTVAFSGLNTTSFITGVVGATEIATNVITDAKGNTTAQFSLAPTQTVNYLDFYINTTPSNAAAGTGFNTGTPILTAHLISNNGVFSDNTNTTAAPPLPFQAATVTNPNPMYSGVTTLQSPLNFTGGPTGQPGGGQVTLTAVVDTVDSAVISTLAPGEKITLVLGQGNTTDQFQQTPATSQFITNGAGTIVPNIGPVNALSGPDLLFQTNGTFSFTVVPEPATMALGLLGLGGLAFGRIVRRRKTV